MRKNHQKKIKNNKMRALGEPLKGHHGQKMFFMHPSDTSSILVEIVENKNGKGIKNEN